MSMISEQVKELKDYANLAAISKNEENMILRAADTIEALSTKLQAANTENVGGWITCEDRIPNDGETVLASDGRYMYTVEYDADLDAAFGEIDGIIAWHPLPEPYKLK